MTNDFQRLRQALQTIIDLTEDDDLDSEDLHFGSDFDIPFQVARELLQEIPTEGEYDV